MPREYKSKSLKPYKKHDSIVLQQAVMDVKNNVFTLRRAAEHYGINYSVIYRHLKKGDAIKSHGGQTCLSNGEERILIDRLKICAEWGYPIDVLNLRVIIKEFLDRKGKHVTKFKSNLPGKEFIYSFLKRHKNELSHRMCQNIKRNRAAVSREVINDYFDCLEKELQGLPPQNIVNFDETNLCDDPGRKKIITKRGCKYPERLMNSTKASTSVMFSAAGDGSILPPYVVYKAFHLYNSWTEEGPKFARYNRTKSGWFDSFCFEDWVQTVALPYLKRQTGKRVLIGDNLSSHLTLEVIKLCSENDVHLVFLPANSTHLTQPLDVAFFHPLKVLWRKILEKWKSGPGRNEASLPKDKFPRLLKQLVEGISERGPENIRAGFKKCGIVPLNRNEVLKMLPALPDTHTDKNDDLAIDQSFVDLLKSMRYEGNGAPSTRKRRTKIPVLPGKSVAAPDSSESSGEMSLHESASDVDPPSECESTNSSNDAGSFTPQTETTNQRKEVFETSQSNVVSSPYPYSVQKEDIKEGDWLLVNFFTYSTKARSSTLNKKSFIANVRNVKENGNFTGEFYRQKNSRDFPGLIYGLPDVSDIFDFEYSQVSGRLNPPQKYGRGLKKFDIVV